MTPRERILGMLNDDLPDKMPFAHIDRHLPRGEREREARNLGMGLICHRPSYIESISNVEIVTKNEPNSIIRTYHTPIGSLTEILRVGIGYGIALFGRDWKGIQPLRTQFLVKKPEDYKILRFIIENIHYKPYYFPIEDQTIRLGDDGIVVSTMPYEPLQRLIIEWVGHRLFIDLAKNQEIVEEVYELLEKKYEEELFPIAADSPSEVVLYGGNIDSVLVSPSLFEKYYLPTYSKAAKVLHSKKKLLDVHMDGKLKALAELISRSAIDIVEAFTPPPMGDLQIDKARSLWKKKIIWINFPSAISTVMGPRPKFVKEYLLQQLKLMIPGDRTMIIASTENFVPEENVVAMAEVMKKTTLPLTEEAIEKMLVNLRNY